MGELDAAPPAMKELPLRLVRLISQSGIDRRRRPGDGGRKGRRVLRMRTVMRSFIRPWKVRHLARRSARVVRVAKVESSNVRGGVLLILDKRREVRR